MAITILGSAQSSDGTWQIDYDSVGLTVGHTVTQGTAAGLVLTADQVDTTTGLPTGLSFSKDVSADFGKGRVVDFSGVPNSVVPPHVKGTIYPFTFTGTWTH